jgi:hypothetical protein
LARFASSMRRNRIGMRVRGVRAGDEQDARVRDVVVAGGRCVGAQRELVARHRAAHAQPRVGVDVVRADEALGQLVEDVVVLGEQLARDVEADRIGSVLVHDAWKRSAAHVERGVPPRACGASRALARCCGCSSRVWRVTGCAAVRCSVLPLVHRRPRFAGWIRIAAHAGDLRPRDSMITRSRRRIRAGRASALGSMP